MTSSFESAYLNTLVTIEGDSEDFVFSATNLDGGGKAWLDQIFPGVTGIFVITAWNPRSEVWDESTNRAANRNLLADLKVGGYRIRNARGSSSDEKWTEESLAILVHRDQDLLAVEAWVHSLAMKYEQNAFFKITKGAFNVRGAVIQGLDLISNLECRPVSA
jgi:hypothetical protein